MGSVVLDSNGAFRDCEHRPETDSTNIPVYSIWEVDDMMNKITDI